MSSTDGSRDPDRREAGGSTLSDEDVAHVLDAQAGALHCEIQSVKEAVESGSELPPERVNAVRTELIELQAAVENFLTAYCPETEPWEYAGEHVPPDRLVERLAERLDV